MLALACASSPMSCSVCSWSASNSTSGVVARLGVLDAAPRLRACLSAFSGSSSPKSSSFGSSLEEERKERLGGGTAGSVPVDVPRVVREDLRRVFDLDGEGGTVGSCDLLRARVARVDIDGATVGGGFEEPTFSFLLPFGGIVVFGFWGNRRVVCVEWKLREHTDVAARAEQVALEGAVDMQKTLSIVVVKKEERTSGTRGSTEQLTYKRDRDAGLFGSRAGLLNKR